MTNTNTPGSNKSTALKTVLTAGLTAGVLDASAASIQFMINTGGKSPARVWKYVASGVFGKDALTGDWTMVSAGLLFHFFIATTFATFFYFLYRQFNWISKNIIVSGILYGMFAWTIMNRVVVPLSNTPKIPFQLSKAIIAMLILIFCIGLPISLIVHKLSRSKAVTS